MRKFFETQQLCQCDDRNSNIFCAITIHLFIEIELKFNYLIIISNGTNVVRSFRKWVEIEFIVFISKNKLMKIVYNACLHSFIMKSIEKMSSFRSDIINTLFDHAKFIDRQLGAAFYRKSKDIRFILQEIPAFEIVR